MRALVFRSAYSASRNARASAAFAASIKAHCAVGTETLMLQVRSAHPPMPHRNDPSGHSGVPLGLFDKPKRSSSSRFAAFGGQGGASLSPFSAPKCPFRTFRCSAWLIQFRQRTALSELKRSCFRFAPLTLRWAGGASLPPAPPYPAPADFRKTDRHSLWVIFC